MSNQKPYNSKKKIEDIEISINKILEPWGNKVYVFDFGHYYFDETINNSNDDGNHYVFKTVIKGSQKYIDTLFPNRKDDSTKYKYFKSNIKEVYNISKDENKNDNFPTTFDPPIKVIVAGDEFQTSEWADDLKNKKIGGCLLVSSIIEGNHQSAVWVVLEKPINGLIEGKTYCFMPCKGDCPERNESSCKKRHISLKDDKIQEVFVQIDDLLRNELMHNTELRTNNEIYRQSTRAAITQVFVRNILHNHINILNNLSKEKGLSVGINQLLNEQNAYKSDIKVEKSQTVVSLFSYVANRIKYLNDATIGATYVKKNILKDRSIHRLFKDFDANRILLNHISSKKAFKYTIEFKHNGNSLKKDRKLEVSLPANDFGAQAFYNILENIISNTAEHGKPKTNAEVTFTVNFIDKEPLDSEHPFPDEGNYYRVEIWDNVPINMDNDELENERIRIKNFEWEQYCEYFKIPEKNQTSTKAKEIDDTSNSCSDTAKSRKEPEMINDAADWLVYKINTDLNDSVINTNTHKLRDSSLGLIEMEASAAFLRQEDLSEIGSPKYDLKHGQYYNHHENEDEDDENYYPYFIQAFKHPLDDGQNVFSLGYRFYMKKPEN